jgi:hypothetical protein
MHTYIFNKIIQFNPLWRNNMKNTLLALTLILATSYSFAGTTVLVGGEAAGQGASQSGSQGGTVVQSVGSGNSLSGATAATSGSSFGSNVTAANPTGGFTVSKTGNSSDASSAQGSLGNAASGSTSGNQSYGLAGGQFGFLNSGLVISHTH